MPKQWRCISIGAARLLESPSRRRWVVGALAGVALGRLAHAASATHYPSRPVRFFVGQAPGGPTDRMARLIADDFAARWKHPIVVENHPGATGMIATRLVARAAADGYTLLVASNSVFASAALDTDTASFDPMRALAPVGRFARGGYVFVVRPGLGARTLKEFASLARARPESVSLGTVGGISNSARGVMLLEQSAGIRLLNVPYTGGALYMQAVIAEQIDGAFCDVALALPFAVSGAVHILGAASRQRLALAPDVPTFAEAGFPGVVTEAWYGIVAPAGTPPAVIAELVATLHSTLADADVRRRFDAMGCEAVVETPDDFAAAIRFEFDQARALAEPNGRRP